MQELWKNRAGEGTRSEGGGWEVAIFYWLVRKDTI